MTPTPGGDEGEGRDQPPLLNLVSATVLALAAVLALVWLVPVHTNADAASYDVSPAFMPKVAAWAVLILAAGQMAVSFRKLKASAIIGKSHWPILTDTLAWVVICALIFFGTTRLGFLVAGPLILIACLYAAGQRSWFLIGAIGLIVPLVLDLATWHLFTVDLP